MQNASRSMPQTSRQPVRRTSFFTAMPADYQYQAARIKNRHQLPDPSKVWNGAGGG